ncbi:hypothetical protein R6Z07M_005801 [Ovis aries]
MADIDNKEQSELDQDLDDVEEVEEETGEETKIKGRQLTVQMMQSPQILAALQDLMPLFDKRFEIINAIYEPTEEECKWKPDEEDEILEELKETAKIEDEKKDEEKEDPKDSL